MPIHPSIPHLISAIVLLCGSSIAIAAQERLRFENGELLVSIQARTPQQMAGFYQGRGFTDAIVDVIRQQCYLTVFIKNKSRRVIWLDLQEWQFSNADGRFQRPHRDEWKRRWQQMGIPLANQATFRWTLLPEQLDFQPDEREGGNIVLPRLGKPMRIEARFATEVDRSGKPITVVFDNVECAVDQ